MRIKISMILVLALSLLASCSNTKKEETKEEVTKDLFAEQVAKLVEAYSKKDATTIKSMIDPEMGISVIYREGAIDNFEVVKDFDFEKPVPSAQPYNAIVANTNLKYEALPAFGCEGDLEGWSKEAGLYCDSTIVDNKFSKMVRFFLDNEMAEDRKVTEDTFTKYTDLEKDSRRVILIDEKQEGFVFYLTKKGGKWYFSILDRAATNCGA